MRPPATAYKAFIKDEEERGEKKRGLLGFERWGPGRRVEATEVAIHSSPFYTLRRRSTRTRQAEDGDKEDGLAAAGCPSGSRARNRTSWCNQLRVRSVREIF